jgi:hypothetical protein
MGGVFNVVNLHVYHYAGNNPVKYIDPDGRADNLFLKILKSISAVPSDNSTKIFTIGLAGSETSMPQSLVFGGGIYINPKNDILFILSLQLIADVATEPLGLMLFALNIEDAGFYGEGAGGPGLGFGPEAIFSPSFSFTLTIGMFNSVKEASGPYTEIGGSVAIMGLAAGADIAFDLRTGNHIGSSMSLGIGFGSAVAEIHQRFGATALYSLLEGFIPLKND